jgi:4'-phosphopantetheinyl transferase
VTTGTVHVWTVGLDVPPAIVCQLLNWLSGEERARSAKFHTTESRLRFIVAHGALRGILARYVGVGADQLRFETSSSGKPSVVGSAVPFNLSQCEGLALCAVAGGGHVGVDLERIRPVPDADALVLRHFAAGEARSYQTLPLSDRVPAFFSTWTRKEAFLKATGEPMHWPLDSFEVDVSPAASSPGLVVSSHRAGGPTFHLRSFRPFPGYVAAVALDEEIRALEFFDWAVS